MDICDVCTPFLIDGICPKIALEDIYFTVWYGTMAGMMVIVNRQRSEEKISQERKAIRELQMEQERITVPKLIKMTGLSRGFFYKNPTVHKEMDDAVQNQAGLIDPRRAIIDQAMEGWIELLEQQVRELQGENEELKKRNTKLQKALDRKDLNFIKNL